MQGKGLKENASWKPLVRGAEQCSVPQLSPLMTMLASGILFLTGGQEH